VLTSELKLKSGATLDWGTLPQVSEFRRVIKAKFAELLQPLINISFPKIVGERGKRGSQPNIKKISGQHI
jgi:hypothetical protein